MHEHVTDVYVQRSKAEGYRSRAAYKLMEIDDRDRLIRPGDTVVDLGAAPGGWSQVVAKRLSGRGRLRENRRHQPAVSCRADPWNSGLPKARIPRRRRWSLRFVTPPYSAGAPILR